MNLKNTPVLTIVGVVAAVVAAGAFFGSGIIDSIRNPTAKVEMKRTVAGNIDSGRFTVTLGAMKKSLTLTIKWWILQWGTVGQCSPWTGW